MLAVMRFAVTALVALVLVVGGNARAQSLTAADRTAIQTVIKSQIEALRQDDFDGAYAFAAPAMKVLYPTVQLFSSLMRNRYAPLIKPKSVVFGTITQTSQGPVQRIFITGADGRPYVANYSLQLQADMNWLIAGITVARDNSSSGI